MKVKTSFNRRDFLKTVGAGAAAVAFPGLISNCTGKGLRPSFIIFVADDVGWNDVGAYGHPHIRTPNIDRLAREGMQFTHAYLTCASCSPTRSSIMTGRYPHSSGAGELHQPLPPDAVVFAGLLAQGGYYTASAGKWHLGDDARKNFDLIEDGRPSGCEEWVEVLRKRPKDQPFFMWFASFDAHRGYEEEAIPEPHQPEDAVVPPFLPDTPETRADLALYYDEISRLDSYVGKVDVELERQGIAEDTFVLFISDNGRPFPRCKTTLYDSGIKTPFIVRWPGKVKAGSECHSLVSVVDIAPTILSLAGINLAPTFQGTSFAPLLTHPEASIRDYAYTEHNWHDYQAHERGVRSQRYLYIRNAFPELPGTPPADAVRSPTYRKMQELHARGELIPVQASCFIAPRPAEELYDTVQDPYSLLNLAGDPEYAQVLAEMQEAHRIWAMETADKVPEQPTPDGFDRHTGKRLPQSQG